MIVKNKDIYYNKWEIKSREIKKFPSCTPIIHLKITKSPPSLKNLKKFFSHRIFKKQYNIEFAPAGLWIRYDESDWDIDETGAPSKSALEYAKSHHRHILWHSPQFSVTSDVSFWTDKDDITPMISHARQ